MLENQNTEQTEKLFELIEILNHLNDFDEILRLLTGKITSILQADGAFIMMLNPDTQRTIKTAMHTGSKMDDKHIRNLKMQITGWLSNNESSLLSENIVSDTRFSNLKLDGMQIKSVIADMVKIEDEEIGSLIVYNSPDKGNFTEADLKFLEKVSLIAAPYLRSLEQRR